MSTSQNFIRWEARYTVFCEYIKQFGRFPPLKTVYNGIKIGQWYYNQVSAYKKGTLSSYRLYKLDAVHPAWKDGYLHKSAANKHLLLVSDWKQFIPVDEVPIDQVLSGEQLLYCIRKKVYSCKDYLIFFEAKYGNAFWKPTGGQTLKNGDLFSFDTRRRIFNTQFPTLDFGCFNLYYACAGKKESYVSMACAYHASGTFSSGKEMLDYFRSALCMLTVKEGEILTLKYMHGLPLREISARTLSDKPRNARYLSLGRIQQLEQKAICKLQYPVRLRLLKPYSPVP